MFWRLTLPLMAPTLLLLMFRDTIFSFQANFVPALIVTEGGPHPYATTVPAALHLPERVRVPALRLCGGGDADDVPRHRADHLPAVPHREALAPRFCRLALRADVPPKVLRLSAAKSTELTIRRANVPAPTRVPAWAPLGLRSGKARLRPRNDSRRPSPATTTQSEMARAGIEPATPRFSAVCSTN